MARQVLIYNGTVFVSDSASGPNRIVEADANNQINIAIANLSGMLIAGAGVSMAGAAKTSNFTADQTITFYEVNATGGAVTGTLPAVATVPNQVYVFIKTDSSGNAMTVKGNGSENINGANTQASSSQWGVIRVRANAAGTAWYQF